MTDVTERYDAEPQVIGGRYELGTAIGYGGMAEVYRGRDIRLNREVAIKTLRADLARDPTFLDRFRREAQSSAALNHPSIVSVYDTGEDVIHGAQIPYIVMEFVQGRTLRDVLQTEGRFSERRAMEITADVCAALDYSHRMGIIHRDIKPANVMLCTDGSVKVMDFGIARATTATTSALTATAAVIGTAQYLSPEQARGARVDARSDVYSTGVLLYELLTGQPPFRGDNPVAVAFQHVKDIPPPPSSIDRDISPEADAIVAKALEKNPDDRYSTAGEMRDDLERALSGRRVLALSARTTARYPAADYPDPEATQLGYPADPEATRLGPATTGTAMLNRGGGYDRYDDRYGEPYDDGPYDDQTRYREQPYDDRYGTGPYDRHDRPPARPEEQPRSSAWKFILAGVAAVAVFVVVALLAGKLFSNGGGDSAASADQITIPEGLIGQSYDVAVTRLKGLGFTGEIRRENREDPTKEEGTVLDTDPAVGEKVAADGVITLIVASAPGQVTIPNDIIGKSQAEAESILGGLNLQTTVIPVSGPASQRVGAVERTEPPAGSAVSPGTTVTLYVVSQEVIVPDVTGLTAEDATRELRRFGLTVQQQPTEDPSAQPGTVVNQSPRGDSTVSRGSSVTIYVVQDSGQQPPTTQSPSPTRSTSPTQSPSPTQPPTTPPTTSPPAEPTTPGGGDGGSDDGQGGTNGLRPFWPPRAGQGQGTD